MEINDETVRKELLKVKIEVNSIWDLVNTNESYPEAILVLLDLFQQCKNNRTREGLVRSLACKEAKGKVGAILMAEYNKIPEDGRVEGYGPLDGLRWAIGNTVYATMTKEDVDGVLSIVCDKANGLSRQMFVMALGKIKGNEEVEDVLIQLLDDDEVVAHAISALKSLKSRKAKEKIEGLLNHPRKLVRTSAQKALERIIK